jgi:hypothetical protein
LGSAFISQCWFIVEKKDIVINKQTQTKGFWPTAQPAHRNATMREQDPMHVMSASKLGEYTVVQEIAEGTFGKVKSMYLGS